MTYIEEVLEEVKDPDNLKEYSKGQRREIFLSKADKMVEELLSAETVSKKREIYRKVNEMCGEEIVDLEEIRSESRVEKLVQETPGLFDPDFWEGEQREFKYEEIHGERKRYFLLARFEYENKERKQETQIISEIYRKGGVKPKELKEYDEEILGSLIKEEIIKIEEVPKKGVLGLWGLLKEKRYKLEPSVKALFSKLKTNP